MKIKILSFRHPDRKHTYSVKRIYQTAKDKGHDIKIIRNFFCQLDFTKRKPRLLYRNKPFPKADVIIVRPEFNKDYEIMAGTIKQLESMHYPLLNGYIPVIISKNKIRTLQYLSKHHVDIPKSIVIQNKEYLPQTVSRLKKFPVVLKIPSGYGGKGVVLVKNKQQLDAILDLYFSRIKSGSGGQQIIVQEYIKESKGKDVRVFVVGGKIVAAMERIGKPGEFRSNFSLGGKIKIADLTKEEKNMALKACEVLELDYGGVDVLRTKSGPKIIEVNSNPGLEGIEQATNLDLAEKIIDFAVKKAKAMAKINPNRPNAKNGRNSGKRKKQKSQT